MASPAAPVQTTSFLDSMELLLVNSGMRFLAACLILAAGWVLATWVKRWLVMGLARLPLDLTLKPLLASLIRYAILIVTLLLVLEQFGVQTTSLIAVLGAAGLAIGLAIQGTLSNVAAGVMLLVLRPFRVGQFVEIGGQSGTVDEIGLFTTLLTTRDMVYLSIPNSSIFSAVIINYTRQKIRRVKFTVPVDIANDLGKVQEVIIRALAADKHALKDPAPSAGVQQLQEYTALMFARAFVASADYWRALPSLQKSVKDALDENQILYAVTRQAAVVRNEPQSAVTQAPPQTPPDA